jgi:hypothetical protein
MSEFRFGDWVTAPVRPDNCNVSPGFIKEMVDRIGWKGQIKHFARYTRTTIIEVHYSDGSVFSYQEGWLKKWCRWDNTPIPNLETFQKEMDAPYVVEERVEECRNQLRRRLNSWPDCYGHTVTAEPIKETDSKRITFVWKCTCCNNKD